MATYSSRFRNGIYLNNKILYLIFTTLIICILGGCAYTTETVKIEYTPSRFSKVTDTTKTIEVSRLKDMRGVDGKLLFYKGTRVKTSGAYVSEREVSDIVTEAIKNLLSNQNFRVVNDNGDLALTGEIFKFDSYHVIGPFGEQIEGIIQLNLRLMDDKNGNIIWNEILTGSAKKTGVRMDRVSPRKELIESTLDNLMFNISESTSLKKAIERSD